jgi:ABC-2 type transport system ATP-binding protein
MTATGAQPAARLHGLTKRYGPVTAVDALHLTIKQGEVVALLGPNGAGKSTTIDMLLGLTRPDSGDVHVFGLDPGTAVRTGRVGALLQSGGLLPDLTVTEIVTLAGALHAKAARAASQPPREGVTATRGATAVAEALDRAGAGAFAKQRVGGLSGGQQQRVRFAMALIANPDLLVLDEPTTGLDVEARRAFWAAMREETRQGRTVLFATHYLEEADDYADRVVLMRGGRIVADGTAAQLRAVATGRTIRALLPGADVAELTALPGVDTAETRGDTIILTCADSDVALRALLNTTPARDVEVTAPGLEEAFLALTVDAPEGAVR